LLEQKAQVLTRLLNLKGNNTQLDCEGKPLQEAEILA
jgi:hypothetical protein